MTAHTRQFGTLLQNLEKAVHSGNIAAIVPEDLELEAHNLLWNETDEGELSILKYLPSVEAKSIVHEFTQINSYGNTRNSGFFGERSLPPETNFGSERQTVNIRLMGEVGPTFLLASLEKTQKALDTEGAENIEEIALRRNVLHKKAVQLYFSDTRTTRLGASSLRFKGIAQQIAEGTEGITGTSPFGSHMVNLDGAMLPIEMIREWATRTAQLFGRINSLFMDPLTRSMIEAQLDSAYRINLPVSTKPYLLGQQVEGLQTQGGVVRFVTDNTLSPMYCRPQYSADIIDGAPSTIPTASASAAAAAGGRTSKFGAADAGEVFYVVTEVVDELEGLGRRVPATGYIEVAAGDEVTLQITPGNAQADSFRVYRGTSDDSGNTDAWFIFEVANSANGAAVTAYDGNQYRPNTSWAFGLRIKSKSQAALQATQLNAYDEAVSRSETFLKRNDKPGNTVAVAELGPSMGMLELAAVLATTRRPLVYSACAPEVRNPRQAVVFYNIGTAASV